MRIAVIFVVLSVMLFACRTSKKIQNLPTTISQVDTTPASSNVNSQTDKVASDKAVLDRIIQNRIDFETFSARARVHYESNDGDHDATAFVRMKKDSAIWLSLRGALGIEGFRVLITQDSVKAINLLKKTVQYQTIGYLQQFTGMKLDLTTMQDLILGNPVFIDTNIVSHQVNANNQLLVSMVGTLYKNLVALDNSDNRLLFSTIEDKEVGGNRTCQFIFSNYDHATGVWFATGRKILLTEQAKLDISMDFKQYAFNQPVSFPFNIPKNYQAVIQ